MTVALSSAAAGSVGFLVVVLLGLATWLLLRSLNTRLRNVRANASHWPGDDPPATTHQPSDPPP